MKTILVVCDQADIDTPLRKSLGHLVNSCEIRMTPNGFEAFDELGFDTFDLVVVDSEVTGLDSLEFVESVDYIDPGVPVIMMLHQAHKSMWGPARMLRANPIVRPFKPVTFLRLVDTLLHEQLERYRDLAEMLRSILESLALATQATATFLVDGSGFPLISTGDLDDDLLRMLGGLAVSRIGADDNISASPDPQTALLADNDQEKDHQLYLTVALENLYLAVIRPAVVAQETTADFWHLTEQKVKDVATAFFENVSPTTSETTREEDLTPNGTALARATTKTQLVIPLKLATVSPFGASHANETGADQQSINWQIIPDTSNLVGRLQDFCQLD
jgi:CheY-like chemotaxis protein